MNCITDEKHTPSKHPEIVHPAAGMLRCLGAPDDIVELRPIRRHPNGDTTVVGQEWIRRADIDSRIPRLKTLNESDVDIYFGTNPRCRIGGGNESDVGRVTLYHSDVDGAPPLEALQRVDDANLPAPSVVVASGGGSHLFWKLAAPVDVTDDNLSVHKGVNKGLAQLLNGDAACRDLSRVLRLPGFVNHKYPGKPVVEVIRPTSFDSAVPEYDDIEFDHIVVPISTSVDTGNDAPPLAQLPQNTISDWQLRIEQAIARSGDRSTAEYGVYCRMIEHGFGPSEVWTVAKTVGKTAQRGPEYFWRTFNAASQAVEAERNFGNYQFEHATQASSDTDNGPTPLDGAGEMESASPEYQQRIAEQYGDDLKRLCEQARFKVEVVDGDSSATPTLALKVDGKVHATEIVSILKPRSKIAVAKAWSERCNAPDGVILAELDRVGTEVAQKQQQRRKRATQNAENAVRVRDIARKFIDDCIQPVYHENGTRFYSNSLKQTIPIGSIWTHAPDGIVDCVSDSREAIEAGNGDGIGPELRVRLFKVGCQQAAADLIRALPEREQIEDDPAIDREALVDRLAEFLTRRRRFSGSNGISRDGNFLGSAWRAAVGSGWVVCGSDGTGVYARRDDEEAPPQIAVMGQTLREELKYASTKRLARDLRTCNLAEVGKAISVARRKLRILLLAPEILASIASPDTDEAAEQ